MPTQIKYLDYDGLVYYHSKVKTALGNKVDKVSGKGLSTNDFTNTLKNKLDGIAAGAEVNVQSNWAQTNSSADDFIKNKPSIPAKTSDLTNDSNFVTNTSYATANTGGVVKVGSGLEITNGVLSATGGGVADEVEWDNVLNKPTFSTVATSGSYNDLTDKPTPQIVNDATLTIQRNNTNVGTFTANASSDKTINIAVPTTVAELSDASAYVTQSNLATQLANKQNVLTAGDHINITDSTIKAVDYVHSDDPVSTSAVTPVVTNDMIADGTITADKLATGATLKLTLSTSDIGEGAALAANTLYGVYE